MKEINIIDLFAGPGGLGEGFSAFQSESHLSPFKIRMSVEKEGSAHRTLTLRSLYRKLSTPAERQVYHAYVSGEISKQGMILALPDQWESANRETMSKATALGQDNREIHNRLEELKKQHDDKPWVVIGGPPCQAYSLVGRSRNKGKADYRPEDDTRHYLYKEYLQVLSIIQPDVFVMENVKGILTSRVDSKRIFPVILKDLRNPSEALELSKSGRSYHVYSFVQKPDTASLWADVGYVDDADFVIRSEDFGLPQARHRVILLGVAADLNREPEVLSGSAPVFVEQVLAGLPVLRSRLSKQTDGPEEWAGVIRHWSLDERLELERMKLGRVAEIMDEECTRLKKHAPLVGKHYEPERIGNDVAGALREWLLKDAPGVVLNHESRSHIAGDLRRYFFCSSWARAFSGDGRWSPKAGDFPSSLEPDHMNWKSGHFSDRFRVQAAGRPATTITSHISKDGHYFIHPDPSQCRSMTVREAARVQTFPDNYFFEGSRTEQYVQVGNAVPPFLARQLAGIVWSLLSNKGSQ